MAHMIETIAYSGEKPWHGIGVEIDADSSTDEVIVAAGLDWDVNKVPMYIDINGKKVATDQYALVRSSDDRILDTVSEHWNVVQNSEAFEFFDEYCHAGDIEISSAGSLQGGKIVWALGKIKESFEVFGGDQVDSYLLFTNPHKFGQCIDVRFTPIRVVCNNTITMALSDTNAKSVKVSHRSVFDPASVKETLGIATDKLRRYKEVAEFLGSVRYDQQSLEKYLGNVFPVFQYRKDKQSTKELSRAAQTAVEIIEQQPGNQYARGTWWQALNAVTYMTDHVIGRSADTRIHNAWFGRYRDVKLKAVNDAVMYAQAA